MKPIYLLGAAALLFLFMNKQTPGTTEPGTTPGTTPGTGTPLSNDPLVQQWIAVIQNTPEWVAEIQRKATSAGVPYEEQLLFDAKWVIDQGWQLPG